MNNRKDTSIRNTWGCVVMATGRHGTSYCSESEVCIVHWSADMTLPWWHRWLFGSKIWLNGSSKSRANPKGSKLPIWSHNGEWLIKQTHLNLGEADGSQMPRSIPLSWYYTWCFSDCKVGQLRNSHFGLSLWQQRAELMNSNVCRSMSPLKQMSWPNTIWLDSITLFWIITLN